MANKKPLAIYEGEVKEIQIGDALDPSIYSSSEGGQVIKCLPVILSGSTVTITTGRNLQTQEEVDQIYVRFTEEQLDSMLFRYFLSLNIDNIPTALLYSPKSAYFNILNPTQGADFPKTYKLTFIRDGEAWLTDLSGEAEHRSIDLINQYGDGTKALMNDGIYKTVITSIDNYNNKAGADVSIAVANTWYTGTSISLPAGTWYITGQITLLRNTTTAITYSARISDGTTHYASAGSYQPSVTNSVITLPLTTVVTLLDTTAISIQATANQTALIKAALVTNGAGANATQITAIKIA